MHIDVVYIVIYEEDHILRAGIFPALLMRDNKFWISCESSSTGFCITRFLVTQSKLPCQEITEELAISELFFSRQYRPLSRRLDRCDRVIQDESGDSNGGNV